MSRNNLSWPQWIRCPMCFKITWKFCQIKALKMTSVYRTFKNVINSVWNLEEQTVFPYLWKRQSAELNCFFLVTLTFSLADQNWQLQDKRKSKVRVPPRSEDEILKSVSEVIIAHIVPFAACLWHSQNSPVICFSKKIMRSHSW